MKQKRLQELDHSGYEIVKGEPDIRGWDVRYRNGEKIGSVEELILDAKAKKVRYMIVDLDENELRLEHRKVLIPIGLAELDKDHDDVLMPNVSVDQICYLPDYNRNNLTPEVERRISSTFGRKLPVTSVSSSKEIRNEKHDNDEIGPDFYTHEHYDAENLYKNRVNELGRQKTKEANFEHGLRLWERRNEGGIIDTSDLTDEEREKLLRYRRELYRERRYKDESV
jgi:sporulation protein YlmC with PRC-barrel domain